LNLRCRSAVKHEHRKEVKMNFKCEVETHSCVQQRFYILKSGLLSRKNYSKSGRLDLEQKGDVRAERA
jgi:hypothetical protein